MLSVSPRAARDISDSLSQEVTATLKNPKHDSLPRHRSHRGLWNQRRSWARGQRPQGVDCGLSEAQGPPPHQALSICLQKRPHKGTGQPAPQMSSTVQAWRCTCLLTAEARNQGTRTLLLAITVSPLPGPQPQDTTHTPAPGLWLPTVLTWHPTVNRHAPQTRSISL